MADPRSIGRYQIESVIGAGAFATVYRAADERLEDTVAIKLLADNHSLNFELRERFLSEGRVIRRIASPHVITVHDLGETAERQPYLVLEYADRGTLSDRAAGLRAAGWRPSAADLWAVAEPLGQALEAMHRIRIVHRDLNPGNVLLTSRGQTAEQHTSTLLRWDERVLLADLGLCKDLARSSGHTSAGGTEGFRPPEMSDGPAIIDERSDLWSLSALIAWLVIGDVVTGHDVEASVRAAGLPSEVARVLEQSLAPDPADRHPDPDAWLDDIERALHQPGRSQPTEPPVVPPPPPEALSSPLSSPWPQPSRPAHSGVPGEAGSYLPPSQHPPAHRAGPWAASPGPRPERSLGWKVLHSAWLLATLPLGFTTWAGFLYIGLRARRRPWLLAAAGYGLAIIAAIAFNAAAPVDAQGSTSLDTWHSDAMAAIAVAVWLGGIVHGLAVNPAWLRWRAQA